MKEDLRDVREWFRGRRFMGETPRWFQAVMIVLIVLVFTTAFGVVVWGIVSKLSTGPDLHECRSMTQSLTWMTLGLTYV